MEAALPVLRKYFGYGSFRPPQDEIIDAVMAGRDCFVLMPTGAGKSICYQIPGIMRPGVGIVVSPLISLMKDQVDGLRENGVSAAYYNSTLGDQEAFEVLEKLDRGELDLLFVAPERLKSQGFQDRLHRAQVALFAIDEAHCVSQWGHDFRPDYVELGKLRPEFPNVPWIALTATADQQTRDDVLHRLNLSEPQVFISGFDRPNIRYTVVDKARPLTQVEKFILERPQESGIVYCLSRKRVEQVAAHLQRNRISAAAYHAGMPAEERTRVQEAFQKDEVQVVVATVAFGMGIDKPDVRFVIHYDIPKNIEGYYQETGRAGRDGLPSEALMLYGPGDIMTVRKLIGMSENAAQKEIELRKLNSITDFAEAQTCRRRLLLGYFGDEATEDCGNCDICLNPPESYNATADVKAALMAVYETKQRFGLRHIIDVLRGSEAERIGQFGHNQLKSYGVGKPLSVDQWGSIFRQLIHLGYLRQETENYNILKLTPLTRGILREGEEITLAKPRMKVEKKERKRRGRAGTPEEYDEELFQRLRTLRREIATEEDIPPYMVFGDQTLIHMAAHKPKSEEELLQIPGVGERKLEKYGSRFLRTIMGLI